MEAIESLSHKEVVAEDTDRKLIGRSSKYTTKWFDPHRISLHNMTETRSYCPYVKAIKRLSNRMLVSDRADKNIVRQTSGTIKDYLITTAYYLNTTQ